MGMHARAHAWANYAGWPPYKRMSRLDTELTPLTAGTSMTINGPWPSAGVNEDNQCEGTGHMTCLAGTEITISRTAARSLDNNWPQSNPDARDIRKPPT